MSEYNSTLIVDDCPSTTLSRIRSLLLLYMSVDWDSPMAGAEHGKDVLLDEVVAALEHTIELVADRELAASRAEEASHECV